MSLFHEGIKRPPHIIIPRLLFLLRGSIPAMCTSIDTSLICKNICCRLAPTQQTYANFPYVFAVNYRCESREWLRACVTILPLTVHCSVNICGDYVRCVCGLMMLYAFRLPCGTLSIQLRWIMKHNSDIKNWLLDIGLGRYTPLLIGKQTKQWQTAAL